ncbi:DNA-directed RNA polymerase subunit alpha [Candidatus Jorgensenbacteria bacterium CG_4_10_14_0_8_um_filter_39_13]|uniref:DNA-directed RNA polymerase subunit alpha n=2 Tax=Candidatus Joergenseniibacteriota TaxID=1752739 RepID=A0A2M7RIJ0_9BACT|nr:MAG: DNA-directed RNA polymerase subunit alpha [Candidatus Jorgensenbacteria bacterium CG11_big_fil_rev_8_21_14_0_20_38_23]PIV13293.1 MAG: DNA-directed RNA polymerase subunit alpha [Candidatus Jorgensenbacteria bacterium CG03_land_8_20_14_0_80_38_39]PIW97824.1 MAG: DNA-directed RNA polymerase subunit alpha [Candidatus Jorgensenbacteria bacterium CG_4_8_14_3_um_filter_38_10]PIY96578.1 MAG: DNA-directed RNA polymerase subunit alpha [Candidatus Jorgensenbacteria bacterium CG_4_10_14_0_8_um_filte
MKYSHLSETVKIKKISEKDNVGLFYVEGLYTGYGVTLGNALRRTLLSSLPGAAITQVKIKGISHEFSTLPGIVEDIIELTLNLKKVRFHFFAEEPQILKLHVKGEKEMTAADIESTTFVQVVNPSLHLATLTKKQSELEMELIVEKGLGYLTVEAKHLERLSIGTIVLDAIFSPIVRVEFKVENMRVGERTDYNRLIIEVETDGSITPSEALHKTANILKDHFDKFSALEIIKTVVAPLKISKEVKKKGGQGSRKKKAK